MTEQLDDIKLTNDQKIAYQHMADGKNVFLTGAGGVGKSLCIKLFKQHFCKEKRIAITSTTGISAINIGGTTLHSYLGIRDGSGSINSLVARINKTKYLKERWLKLDVLVIDEVSMLSPDLFDKLEEIARIVRSNGTMQHVIENAVIAQHSPYNQPFGGIQLILSGDFAQLPVIGCDRFCFEAKTWDKCIDETVYLTTIMRQTDEKFQSILNDIRFGKITKQVKKFIKERSNIELKTEEGVRPTKIFTTNADVDAFNEEELDELNNDDRQYYQYEMEVYMLQFTKDRGVIDKFKKSCLAPSTLDLCVDAQVMLVCNLDQDRELVNGSRGVVVGFDTRHIERNNELVEQSLPIVRFLNGTELIIDYHTWEIEQDDKPLLQIKQIPLKLAWAITTHKSQSCTLDYAEVYLDNIFTYGLAYVALSRARTIDGLSIRGIDLNAIQCHPKAVDYYLRLSGRVQGEK